MFSKKEDLKEFIQVLWRQQVLAVSLAEEKESLDPMRSQQLMHDADQLKLIRYGLIHIAEELETGEESE